MNFKRSLIVNLLGGPGASKSTIMAGIFHDLKFKGIEVEMAFEFAKDNVWEGNSAIFENQIKIFGEQHHRIFRLLNKVEVILTDSSLLLTPIYYNHYKNNSDLISKLAVEEYHKMWNYNVFIKRHEASFQQNGRNHDINHAKQIDREILDLLETEKIPFETVHAGPEAKDYAVRKILQLLN